MRKFYLLLIVLLSACFQIKAQTTLHFTIKQPPALTAYAGTGTTIRKGGQVQLGAITPATGGSGSYRCSWTPATGLNKTDIGNPTASPDSTTTYTLTVYDATGCFASSQITVTVAPSIINSSNALGLVIYPNPNTGTFSIATEKELTPDPVLLEIFDPIGKVVYSEKLEGGKKLNKTIRLLSHAKGMYILKFTGGELNAIRKIILQ